MLKKMLLFIAISSSFLPIFGETDGQRTERQKMEQRFSEIEDDYQDLRREIRDLRYTQMHHAICIALTGVLAAVAIIIAKSSR